MGLTRRRMLLSASALVGVGQTTLASAAPTYPDKPVHIVVPFSAGGVGDVLARLMADRLSQRLGQQFIVDNKPGAGGSIGTEFVARAPADGYTLLLASPGFTVNPTLQSDIKWNPIKDFSPVSMLATIPNVVVVGRDAPYQSFAQLMDEAKRQPGKLTFASAGVGSSPHLAGELLNVSGRVKMTHVPYKGQSDAISDLMAGRVTFMALTIALAIPQIKDGRLRPLAVTSSKRATELPQVPTVSELGLPGYEIDGWIALFAPAHTPTQTIDALHSNIRQILAEPPVQATLAKLNCEVSAQTRPAELGQYVQQDFDKWARIIKSAGIKSE